MIKSGFEINYHYVYDDGYDDDCDDDINAMI